MRTAWLCILCCKLIVIFGQWLQNPNPTLRPFPTVARLPAGQSDEPSHLVLASRIIRPGTVYKVVTSMLQHVTETEVWASISRDGAEIAGARATIQGGHTEVLLLKIPQTSVPGRYRLIVEGQSNDIFGESFFKKTDLDFSERFLTILIQSSRPVYNADQLVRIRAIVLTMEMKPYTDPVTINILDPNGFIMANFRSVQLNVGVGVIQYTIPSLPVVGSWIIQVIAYGQIEERPIMVEKGYYTKMEVDVWMNEFVLETDENLTGEVEVAYLTNSYVYGNITLRVYAFPPGADLQGELGNSAIFITDEFVPEFRGKHEFEFSMDDIRQVTTLKAGVALRVVADVHDLILDTKETSWSTSMIVEGKVTLKFLGSDTKVFKPGMPYSAYMAVMYSDSSPLEEEKLSAGEIEVVINARMRNGQMHSLPQIITSVPEDGVARIDIEAPDEAIAMVFRALYKDEEDEASAEMTSLASIAPQHRVLQVHTSAPSANIDEYVVVHVRGNFYMSSFNYLVVSKGVIIHAGTEEVELLLQPIKTFSFAVSPEMAPNFHIIVYHITLDGYVIADSVSVPVENLNRINVHLELNFQKDKSGKTVEVIAVLEPGLFYGTMVEDSDTFCHKCGGDITKAYVIDNMHSFDAAWDEMNKVKWLPRDREPDKVFVVETANRAIDSLDTLQKLQLTVITDALFSDTIDACNHSMGMFSCKTNSRCYTEAQKCNGVDNCGNGFDEIGCPTPYTEATEKLRVFRVHRRSRNEQYYDTMEGDWAWLEFNTDDDDFIMAEIPNRPSYWTVSSFAVHPKLGLGILDEAITIQGTRPFYMSAEMPTFCRRGEQVGIRADVFNLLKVGLFVTLVLPESEDYKFVHVEKDGYVHSYNARVSSGEHQHYIWMDPLQQRTVYMPIVPTRVGEIEVTIEAWSNIEKDSATFTLKVLPDGASQGLHTSLLLDLKNQPTVIRYLNINVTETPIVPYDRWRRYIFDSPRAEVSVVGDVFGPAFPTMPVTTESLLLKPDRSAEAMAFNFGANVWTLKYLRLTNQLSKQVMREAFKHMRFYYATVMSFRNSDGSFSMWNGMEPSVWLTANVAKVLQSGRFPDWENEFFIDTRVLDGAITWLIRHQTVEGAFLETSSQPLNSRMSEKTSGRRESRRRFENIPLTAFVLITLCEVVDLDGEVRVKASSAKTRATNYLDRKFNSVNDPFDLALVTYALTLAGSVNQDAAFLKLDAMKYDQEGKVYWAEEPLPLTEYVFENQRPYVQPRLPYRNDALNVEASAYGLLIYIAKEGIAQIQENIVRWINTMRTTHGGFISTQDTLIAMQALADYSFRARLRDVTDMNVRVQFSATGDFEENVEIHEDNLSEMQLVQVPEGRVWGHADVLAHGAGLALLQMDLTYCVDYAPLFIPPAQRSFDLIVDARYYGRNSSYMEIGACQRWVLQNESFTSGVAVFEMDVPSGYSQYKPILYKLHQSRRVPNLRRMYLTDEKVYAFFDHLDYRFTCINFTLERWFPVANMSQYLKAKVYDYYAPERYNETLFHAYNLYLLDICTVCGSYQCPFCYFYSASIVIRANILLVVLLLVAGCLGSICSP